MKAIRVHEFGPPEVMRLEDVPDPQPGPGQVVVRVRAAGVNPVETYIRAGTYGARPLPYTPGSDAGGEVEGVGPGVTQFKRGDRVYTGGSVSGTYAELALCTVDQVHALPSNVTFEAGAGVNVPCATAHRALFHHARAEAGESVLVHGASGGVGTAAVQLARAAGLLVIGTAGTDQGRQLVLEYGAHHVLNHREPDYLKKLPSLTGGEGPDIILEMLANMNLGKDLKVLAPRGRVVVIGSRGQVEIDPRDTMARGTSILGMSLLSPTPPKELMGVHMALQAALANGALRIIVGKQMPLADAAKAHHEIIEGDAHGKIVLKP